MHKSIYTTDLYHLLRYAIESEKNIKNTLDFYTSTVFNTSDFLYPSKVASFMTEEAIGKAIKDKQNMPSSPAIIIDRFRTALTTTSASKIHIFATLPDQSTPSDRLTIVTMKLIAYANRLIYSNADKTPRPMTPPTPNDRKPKGPKQSPQSPYDQRPPRGSKGLR